MKSKIQFANEKVRKAFDKLEKSDFKLYNHILRVFKIIQEDAFYGTQIPKKMIPKEYIKKFHVKNVWKYDLPNAWRLIYSIEGKDFTVFSIILEWMDHKNYERRFGY